MPTDSEYIRYCAEALRSFGNVFNPPGFPVFPTDPPPQTTVTFPSGISVTGAEPSVTGQPHRLHVVPGEPFSFTGGNARRGVSARDQFDSWGAGLEYHITDPNSIHPCTMSLQSGESIVIATPLVGNQFLKLREAVLVEAYVPSATTLAPASPVTLQGATQADVNIFLASTDWVPETREGWAGRAGHALLNFGSSDEDGYGGVIAERTSFGALLLLSGLPWEGCRELVRERLLDLADDAARAQIDFPPDGGHGIGRLFPFLLRRQFGMANDGERISGFAETRHIVPYIGPGNFAGFGWRHHETDPVNMASDYVRACAANRWGGAALVAALLFPNDPALAPWVAFTKAYLRAQDPTSWFHTKHPRSRELIVANANILLA